MGVELPKSPIPKELSPFDLPGSWLKSSILRACLYLISLKAHSLNSPTPGVYKKKKSGATQLPEAGL